MHGRAGDVCGGGGAVQDHRQSEARGGRGETQARVHSMAKVRIRPIEGRARGSNQLQSWPKKIVLGCVNHAT